MTDLNNYNLIGDMPAYRRLLADLRHGKKGDAVVLEAARAYLVAALHRDLGRPLLLVTARPEHARKLHEQFQNWLPAGIGENIS